MARISPLPASAPPWMRQGRLWESRRLRVAVAVAGPTV